MPSYLITGVSRGIGFELLNQLSENPDNVVIGLVRDKATTDKNVEAKLSGRTNIHIFTADLIDYDSLKASFDAVRAVTNGSLDYIIANAGYIEKWSQYDGIGTLGQLDAKQLEDNMIATYRVNVIGNVHLFNVFLPLVLAGQTKKIITISSGMGDMDLTRKYKLELAAPYSISKTAMNAVTTKFHAEYADQGVLFLNICPGVVDTGSYNDATEEQTKAVMGQMTKFADYSPTWKGPGTPDVSAKAIIKQINLASLEGGYGGEYISHKGKGEKWI